MKWSEGVETKKVWFARGQFFASPALMSLVQTTKHSQFAMRLIGSLGKSGAGTHLSLMFAVNKGLVVLDDGDDHTSHAKLHTPHVTRHTSHVTRRTSHVTRCTSHVTRGT